MTDKPEDIQRVIDRLLKRREGQYGPDLSEEDKLILRALEHYKHLQDESDKSTEEA